MKESKKLSFLQQQEIFQKEQMSYQQQSRPSYCSANDSISTSTTNKSAQISTALTSSTSPKSQIKKINSNDNSNNSFTNISLQIPGDNTNKLDEESNQYVYNQAALEALCQHITRFLNIYYFYLIILMFIYIVGYFHFHYFLKLL